MKDKIIEILYNKTEILGFNTPESIADEIVLLISSIKPTDDKLFNKLKIAFKFGIKVSTNHPDDDSCDDSYFDRAIMVINRLFRNTKQPHKVDTSCKCKEEDKHGETSIMCCNECGLPTETFWKSEPSDEVIKEKIIEIKNSGSYNKVILDKMFGKE